MRQILIILISICALHSGAQTFNERYLALADTADRYIKEKRWEDAERAIINTIREEPANKSNILLWGNLGVVRMHLENYGGAVEALSIGLASAPRATTLLNNRASAYLSMNEPEKAIADMDLSLATDSLLEWPLRMRGLTYMAIGKYEKAEQDLKRYIEMHDEDATILESLGDIEMRKGDSAEASQYYRRSEQLEKTEDIAIKKLGAILASGEMAKHADELTDAIKEWPRSGDLYILRALYHKAMYQTDAMEQDLKLARQCGKVVSKKIFSEGL